MLPLIAAALIAVIGPCVLSFGEAQAERVIQIGAQQAHRDGQVFIGKSEDVRTDTSFVDITVGDPEVADVNPLTDRSLSILGKRNGTTRVSVYAEGKKLIGVFDVEVVYDTSLIQSEIRKRFPDAKLQVTAVNGRIMLSGTSPDGADARPRGDDRQAVRPGRHQHGRGAGAAAGHAGGALRRSHAPGRPRARRAMELLRQQQPRQHRQSHAGRASFRSPTPAAAAVLAAGHHASADPNVSADGA